MPVRSSAAKRYAEAAAGLARQDGSWDTWRQDLHTLGQALQDGRLLQALQNERVPAERKRQVVDSLFQGRVSPGARNLLLLLIRRRRLELLGDVGSWFDELADRARGVRRVTVTTAAALTESQRERLLQRLTGASGPAAPAVGRGTVELTEEVDPAIVGGLVVRQGDIIQDYSIKARLEALRERLN
ncbi:MAG TPA: ATP synthase F1 subunit delta [Chloroflexota bacterium]|jgi:F-type H+-transporting ATPase subunit delta|nr:ATP synthase F1 subunit delta [Chloroflexota bacterium]